MEFCMKLPKMIFLYTTDHIIIFKFDLNTKQNYKTETVLHAALHATSVAAALELKIL